MIPMLRNLLSGACLAINPLCIPHLPYMANGECLTAYYSSPSVCTSSLYRGLPAIMREGFIGLGHSMHVFSLLDRVPLARRGVHNLGGEFIDHSFLATIARVSHQPAHRQGDAAGGVDFDRHLIVGATNALRFDLDLRLKVLNRFL